MAANNFNEPVTSKSYPAGEVIDEWNFKGDAAAHNPAVIDGKIVARMPDLGTAPSVTDYQTAIASNVTGTDGEPGALELFRRAFAAAWRGHVVSGGTCAVPATRSYTASATLYRRVSAIGLCAVICGAGILFLDNKEPAENTVVNDTVSNTVSDTISEAGALSSAAPAEIPVVVAPAREVAENNVRPPEGFTVHPADHVPPQPASINDLVGNPWDNSSYAAAPAPNAEPVNMYPIASSDNTPAVYPPAPNTGYPVYVAAERTAYPAPNNVQNQGAAYPPQNTGVGNPRLAIAPAPAVNSGQQNGYTQAYQNNPIPEARGNYLQSAGRVVPVQQYYPNNGYAVGETNPNSPYPHHAYQNAQPQPQYQPNYAPQPAAPQYQQQQQPAQYQTPPGNTALPNYPYDYVPSNRKLY